MDPFVCTWCELDQHQRCWVPLCECTHQAEAWVTPGRRTALRAGSAPRDEHEAALVAAYQAHRAERMAADARRR